MADVTAHDFQLRAITTGFMNSFDFAFVTWWPLIFYPVTDAPNYRKGYIASIIAGALILPLVLVIAFLEKRGIKNGTLGRKFVREESGEEGLDREESGEEGSGEAEGGIVALHLPSKAF